MGKEIIAGAVMFILVVGLAGCIGKKPKNPAATQPVTMVPPEQAEPEYWLRQAATAEVMGRDFETLWAASEQAARSYLFEIDLRDHRRGLLVTKPLIARQWFEPWRKDTRGLRNVSENSLGTIRRTIYFQFTKNLDGSYAVAPKVVIERQSRVDPKYMQEIDEARVYWYALRRDPQLEQRLAQSVRGRLKG